MPSSPDTGALWAAVGPEALLAMLVPLRDEHRRHGAAALIPGDARQLESVVRELPAAATLIVVEDPAQPSVRGRYSSPFLTTAQGDDVLLGWVRLQPRELGNYARRAAALVQRRSEFELALALLGPRERRYGELLNELEQAASGSSSLLPFHWGAERIGRGPLTTALRHGIGAAIYCGHGSADGWFAYGGLSASALAGEHDWACDETTALLFSLSCRTGQPSVSGASNEATRPALADRLIARGAAGAILAPLADPLHADNRRLAHALVLALGDGHRSCRALLQAARAAGEPLTGYAIVGDPGLRAAPSPGAAGRCAGVFAPAPEASLAAGPRRPRAWRGYSGWTV